MKLVKISAAFLITCVIVSSLALGSYEKNPQYINFPKFPSESLKEDLERLDRDVKRARMWFYFFIFAVVLTVLNLILFLYFRRKEKQKSKKIKKNI